MKKKIINKICVTITTAIFVISIIPINVSAKTIKDFENEINEFTSQLEEKEKQIATNDAEVEKIKNRIKEIEGQIQTLEEESATLQAEIDESNNEIAEKSEQSKSLFQYLQVSEGENAYLEYIFGATDITDMVYRMAIVEQLTEYNDQIMDELTALIEENQKRKDELASKQEELNQLTKELETEKERINAESSAIRDSMPSIEQQLKEAKSNLTYYKNLGCGTNEDIYACQYRVEQNSSTSIPSVSGFSRPMASGYVTQNWSGYGGHLGIDLSNTNKTIAIYPIAEGVITRIYHDEYDALCVAIRHNVGGRYIYSTYAHLSSYGNIYEGQYVTTNTHIGNMGNTGYSFGAHLHLEVATCHWTSGGGCSWGEYQKRTINPRQYVGFPSSLRTWWYNK